jgi:hypothetical protein
MSAARRAVAALAAAGLVLAPSAAGAVDRNGTAGLDAIKQAAHSAIETRLTALNVATTVIKASNFMGADQATIASMLAADGSGLKALDTKIQGDTTTAEARADAQKIYTDYRIFALALPVAHMTRAADVVTKLVVPHLTTAEAKLQTAITEKGATSLQPLLDDMKAQTAAAGRLATPLPAALEALKPADWNANHDVLQPDRTAIETARADLRKARQDARQILEGLKK